MRRRREFVIVFFIFFIISLILFVIFGSKNGSGLGGLFEIITSPIQRVLINVTGSTTTLGENSEIRELKSENLKLQAEKAKIKRLEREMAALRDQYKITKITTQNLMPAQIIGRRGFIPGVSVPDVIVINKGKAEGVVVGQVILYKEVVLGRVAKSSNHISEAMLLWHRNSSITALTSETLANGILKGRGNGEILFENVVLSEKLKKGDLVVTKGDINEDGLGFPPDLVIGKILSVDKKQSALFQSAEVKSPIDISKVSDVFIVTKPL